MPMARRVPTSCSASTSTSPDRTRRAALAKVDVPILNLISLYGRSEKEWRESPMGLSMFEGTFNVAVPELAGTIAPTVVGSQEKVTDPETGLTIVVRKPIAVADRDGGAACREVGGAAKERRIATSASRSSSTTTRRERPTSAPAISMWLSRSPTSCSD